MSGYSCKEGAVACHKEGRGHGVRLIHWAPIVGGAEPSVLFGTLHKLPQRIIMTDKGATPPGACDSSEPAPRILDLVEKALELSDLSGFTFVAIDLSSARDKLLAMRHDDPSTNG